MDGSTKPETENPPDNAPSVGGVAGDILRNYIERIERLEEEKKNLTADIREVYAEAKGNGFEPKIMRKVLALRKMDQADRQEEEELLELYARAVGVYVGRSWADTPMGQQLKHSAATPVPDGEGDG